MQCIPQNTVSRAGLQRRHCIVHMKSTIPTQHLDIKIPYELECMRMRICPHYLPVEVPFIVVAAVYKSPKSPAEERQLEHTHIATVLKGKYLNCGFMGCCEYNNRDIRSFCDRETVNVVRHLTHGKNSRDLTISHLHWLYPYMAALLAIGRLNHVTAIFESLCATQWPTWEAITLITTHHRLEHLVLWDVDYIIQLEAHS